MLPFQTENRKRKPRQFSLILLPFAHRANGSLSFFFLSQRRKQKYPFLNGLNGKTNLPIYEIFRIISQTGNVIFGHILQR